MSTKLSFLIIGFHTRKGSYELHHLKYLAEDVECGPLDERQVSPKSNDAPENGQGHLFCGNDLDSDVELTMH